MLDALNSTQAIVASIRLVLRGILTLLILSLPIAAYSQVTTFSEDDLEVSYLYSVVMGSGTYKINGRRITMFRLPFSKTLYNKEENKSGWKLLLPVVIGYDDLDGVNSDIIDSLRPSELVSSALLPGAEYIWSISPQWQLKPFFEMGVAKDFSLNETIYLGQFGVRSLGLFEPGDHIQLRWGATLRSAAEYQQTTGDKLRIGVFETGLDLRSKQHLQILHFHIDIGAYAIYQRFDPKWSSSTTPDKKVEVVELYEMGLSTGLKKHRNFLGIGYQRLRVGYKMGNAFTGWTIGADFPF